MTGRPLNVLKLNTTDPKKRGTEHGEALREMVKELSEIRLERVVELGKFPKVKTALELAEAHLPVLQKYDEDLYTELMGIAAGSNVPPAKIVVLNNYTDMRDIPFQRNNKDDGGCTVIFSPNDGKPVLGQTWDIHASALPFGFILHLGDQIIFSAAGCLGMTGMNSQGMAITINNLNSKEGVIGVLWPAVVRQALKNATVSAAHEDINRAKIGSGRHYALADEKDFLGIEVSPAKNAVISERSDKVYYHTNHCLDKDLEKTHFIREGSNTLWRYKYLEDNIKKTNLAPKEIFLLLRDVSTDASTVSPHQVATCATLVMDIKNRKVLACQGVASEELLTWPKTTITF